jgi:hypothetical protein
MAEQLTLDDFKKMEGQPWLNVTYAIEPGMVQRFVEAVGDHSPRWRGQRPEAPPSLLLTLGFERAISALLGASGAVLHGSTELECYLPVRVGDTITVLAKIAAVRERQSEAGGMAFITLDKEYHNQRQELVAHVKQLAILRKGVA